MHDPEGVQPLHPLLVPRPALVTRSQDDVQRDCEYGDEQRHDQHVGVQVPELEAEERELLDIEAGAYTGGRGEGVQPLHPLLVPRPALVTRSQDDVQRDCEYGDEQRHDQHVGVQVPELEAEERELLDSASFAAPTGTAKLALSRIIRSGSPPVRRQLASMTAARIISVTTGIVQTSVKAAPPMTRASSRNRPG